jgi:predicted Zn-ribbon and HTH transcriptional regulator
MKYWRINTDINARKDAKTYDLWYQYGMAFAGDYEGDQGKHSKVFRLLSVGDGIFMHQSGATGGIVGFGLVKELWNRSIYQGEARRLYVKELFEYRIAVDWDDSCDCRKNPLPIRDRLPYLGTFSEVNPGKWNIESVIGNLKQRADQTILRPQAKKRDYADDLKQEAFLEGKENIALVKFFERNPAAREHCLVIHGCSCKVCGFNFEEFYGEIGRGFVHVHHKSPLSEIQGMRSTDPINDLCPVCPNCHSMIHRRTPCYTIEEMQQIIRKLQQ